jgi:hypothetical protein
MNKILVIFLSAWMSFAAQADDSPLPKDVPRVRWSPDPIYSEEGFRLGYIIDFEAQRFWHYEGSLLMGFDTNPAKIMDEKCVEDAQTAANAVKNPATRNAGLQAIDSDCLMMTNPWQFSVVDRKLYHQYSGAKRAVVVYYNRPVWAPFGLLTTGSPWALIAQTLNYVEKIWYVNPDLSVAKYPSDSSGTDSPLINPASGYSVGYVVKASLDNLLRKTYEVTIQEGSSGADFKRMSVNDSTIFDHLIRAMLTGKKTKVGYVELVGAEGYLETEIRGYHTGYRIQSIETLP